MSFSHSGKLLFLPSGKNNSKRKAANHHLRQEKIYTAISALVKKKEWKLLWQNMFLKLTKYIFKSLHDSWKNNVGERQILKNTGLRSFKYYQKLLLQHPYLCNIVKVNRMYPTAQENCPRKVNVEISNKQDKVCMPQNAEQNLFLYEPEQRLSCCTAHRILLVMT